VSYHPEYPYRIVDESPAPQGGDDAERNADEELQPKSGQSQLKGRGKALEQEASAGRL